MGRVQAGETHRAQVKQEQAMVLTRAPRDAKFRQALFTEALDAYLAGDTATGKALLRDLINATIGFEGLAQEVGKPSKSLHRMLAPRGRPTYAGRHQSAETNAASPRGATAFDTKFPSTGVSKFLTHSTPNTENFFGIVSTLQKKTKVRLQVTLVVVDRSS